MIKHTFIPFNFLSPQITVIQGLAALQDKVNALVIIPLFLLPSCDVVRGGIRLSLGRFPYCLTSSSSSSLGTTSSGTSRHTLCLLVSILCVVLRVYQTGKGLETVKTKAKFLLISDIRKLYNICNGTVIIIIYL